jgi:hypothetical protein
LNTHIEEKHLSPDAADSILTRTLRTRKSAELTRADAVAASGLPSHIVDDSLERLIKRYKSHLSVTEDGELLYAFDPALQRRDRPTFKERLAALAHIAARVGMAVFKVWIAVTLVVYVIAFIVLMIAMAMSGRSRDDDRGGGLGFGWIIWWLMPGWGPGHGYQQRDPWGRPMVSRAHPRGAPKKKFIQSVYDFVFGPAQPVRDRLADEKEILSYLRDNDGRITATDLVAMFGWSYRQAEEEVARLMVDYDGEPEITEEGVLVYAFPKLLKSAESSALAPASSWKPAWQKKEERPVLTSNKPGTDALIAAFAAFNLIMSFVAAGWIRARWGISGLGIDIALKAFPIAFFTLFLSIPLIRLGARKLGDRGRALRNHRRDMIKLVMAKNGGPIPLDELGDKQAQNDLLLALEGEPDLDEKGLTAIAKFPRIPEERAALRKHLDTIDVQAEKKIGPVIFGSDDDKKLLN